MRAARALLNNGIEDEDEIIPTLAFAANLSGAPHLARIWDGLATEEWNKGTWTEPEIQLHDFFDGLVMSSGRIVDNVPVIRHVPARVVGFTGKDGNVEEIAIDIFRRSAKAEQLAKVYERYLRRQNLDYDLSRGVTAHKTHNEFVRILARPEGRSVDPDGHFFPTINGDKFPHPQLIADKYASVRRLLDANSVLAGRKRGPPFTARNLVPACVAWYVGGRRALIGRSEIWPDVAKLLNDELLTPCGKDPVVDESLHPIWRNTETVEPAILRLERAIRDEGSGWFRARSSRKPV